MVKIGMSYPHYGQTLTAVPALDGFPVDEASASAATETPEVAVDFSGPRIVLGIDFGTTFTGKRLVFQILIDSSLFAHSKMSRSCMDANNWIRQKDC